MMTILMHDKAQWILIDPTDPITAPFLMMMKQHKQFEPRKHTNTCIIQRASNIAVLDDDVIAQMFK